MHKYNVGDTVSISGTNPEIVPKLKIINLLPELKYECRVFGKLPAGLKISVSVTLAEHQLAG
ncbi:hypothetical protein H6G69_15725 [Nostoc sp. FACHB-110]|nr:hypothetical protein [Nostoc sp. FACHB-110]